MPDPKTDLKKKVKRSDGRVFITYTNPKGEIVAQEDLEEKVYDKNYPKDDE